MPIKNIVTGQKVTQEKLQSAKELRREMTPASPSVRWTSTLKGPRPPNTTMKIWVAD